jgi:hypothetical protein
VVAVAIIAGGHTCFFDNLSMFFCHFFFFVGACGCGGGTDDHVPPGSNGEYNKNEQNKTKTMK